MKHTKVVGAVAAAVVLALAMTVSNHAVAEPITGHTTVRMSDGVDLDSFVVGAGEHHPLVLIPAEVGIPDVAYLATAAKLAAHGYTVLAYNPRGTFASTGVFDFAGPREIADVSELIDWAERTLGVEPSAIAIAGMGNGGGTGLLAAARDRRLRAVVSLGGWADLGKAWFPGGTPSAQAISTQRSLGAAGSHVGPDGTRLTAIDVSADAVRDLTTARTVDMTALAANRPAVFLGQAWEDSLYPPAQLVDTFVGYPGPLHVELSAGDHSVSDAPGGYLGLPNHDWDTAIQWLDATVHGNDRSAVQVAPMTSAVSALLPGQHYSPILSLAALAPTTRRYLGRGIIDSAPTHFGQTITGGPVGVDSGTVYLNGSLHFLGVSSSQRLAGIDPHTAATWTSDPLITDRHLLGETAVHLVVSSPHAATIVCYLFDVDANGQGSLLTFGPATVDGHGAATVEMQPINVTVATGDHLVLVAGTQDGRYRSATSVGQPVTVSDGVLDLPFR